jgi:hypothetical protein
MTDYQALKRAGHTPAKAAEIFLDAKRGDEYAINWIATIRRPRRKSSANGASK